MTALEFWLLAILSLLIGPSKAENLRANASFEKNNIRTVCYLSLCLHSAELLYNYFPHYPCASMFCCKTADITAEGKSQKDATVFSFSPVLLFLVIAKWQRCSVLCSLSLSPSVLVCMRCSVVPSYFACTLMRIVTKYERTL